MLATGVVPGLTSIISASNISYLISQPLQRSTNSIHAAITFQFVFENG